MGPIYLGRLVDKQIGKDLPISGRPLESSTFCGSSSKGNRVKWNVRRKRSVTVGRGKVAYPLGIARREWNGEINGGGLQPPTTFLFPPTVEIPEIIPKPAELVRQGKSRHDGCLKGHVSSRSSWGGPKRGRLADAVGANDPFPTEDVLVAGPKGKKHGGSTKKRSILPDQAGVMKMKGNDDRGTWAERTPIHSTPRSEGRSNFRRKK